MKAEIAELRALGEASEEHFEGLRYLLAPVLWEMLERHGCGGNRALFMSVHDLIGEMVEAAFMEGANWQRDRR